MYPSFSKFCRAWTLHKYGLPTQPSTVLLTPLSLSMQTSSRASEKPHPQFTGPYEFISWITPARESKFKFSPALDSRARLALQLGASYPYEKYSLKERHLAASLEVENEDHPP